MPRVVVLGAGIGGVSVAFELREKFGRKVDIDVASESEWFHFVPSNPWVSVSWRKPEDVKVHLPPVFARLGIGFHACGAKQAPPEQNEVLLNDGRALP
jgi:sulfide:quinone oxidoreductase